MYLRSAIVYLALFFLIISCEGPLGPDGPQGPQGPQGEDGTSAPIPDFTGTFERNTEQNNNSYLFIGFNGSWEYKIYESGSSIYSVEGTYDWSENNSILFSGNNGRSGTFDYEIDSDNTLTLNQIQGQNVFDVSESNRWNDLIFNQN